MPETAILKTPLPAGCGGHVSFLSVAVINHHDPRNLERKGFVISYRLEPIIEGSQGKNSAEKLIPVPECLCVPTSGG